MDIKGRAEVQLMVEAFYAKVLNDSILSPVFLEVAGIDIQLHLKTIEDYWCKMLFGDQAYQRNTIAIHKKIHLESRFLKIHYDRWLSLFLETVEELFTGPVANKAKTIAKNVIKNMSLYFK